MGVGLNVVSSHMLTMYADHVALRYVTGTVC